MQQFTKWDCPFKEEDIKEIYPEYNQQLLQKLLEFSQIDYSLGCMFGSFIGDSLGSYLEFAKNITPEMVDQAMEMTPGGTFNLRAGQVTDDSEMSFHLLEALSSYKHQRPLQEQRVDMTINIGKQYVKWRKSVPFDMGITTNKSIKIIQTYQSISELQPAAKEKALQQMFQQILQINNKSQSNGSLMRITPLVFFTNLLSIYSHQFNKEQWQNFIKDQVRLVHPNQILKNCSLHWVRTLYMITCRKGNQQLATLYNQSTRLAQKYLSPWMSSLTSQEPISAKVNIGWAKIGWSYGMRQLSDLTNILSKNPLYKLDEFYYQRVIKSVIERGGDTDTNAAIVGGMIGALVGFKRLPAKYIRKMMAVNFSDKKGRRGNQRPSFYEPRRAFVNIYKSLQELYFFKKHIKQMPKC